MHGSASRGKPEGLRKPGRNDPCHCGSGRKFKACCGREGRAGQEAPGVALPAADMQGARAALARAAQAQAQGRPGDAMAALGEAVSRDPGNAAAYLDLGELLIGAGRLADALQCFDRAAGLKPSLALAHVRRGFVLEQLGWHSAACDAYTLAIRIAPRLVEAHSRLGIALLVLDNRLDAARSLRRAAALAPGTSAGRLNTALALVAEGRTDEARTALGAAIAMDPRNGVAHAELGRLEAEAGHASEARAAFEKVVELDPRAAGYYYDLVRVRRLRDDDRPLLGRMLDVEKRTDLHEIQRVMLELAIGKAYDDLDDPESATRYYLAANSRKGRIRPLDRELIARRVDWLIHTFTRECFLEHSTVGLRDSTPLLIVGMPRSGTTLVESVLARHSSVGTGEELTFWNREGRQIAEAGTVPAETRLREIGMGYLSLLRSISSAPHVTDKKPDNFFWAGLIHLVFPDARIVHCRRNPRDTCASILGNFFAPRPDFSTAPDDLVFYYRQYERLMAHWREVLPSERFLEIDYEQLVAHPATLIPRLVRFCGLDWEDACLSPERSSRRVSTASLWQVRQPVFTSSVGRWGRYERWLGELRALPSTWDGVVLPGEVDRASG